MDNQRASLTERRRSATQVEISRAAATLFAQHGLAGTTVEEIATAAGVSLRTFYRYFPSKQEAVVPLLRMGAANWRERLGAIPPDADVREAVARAVARSLTAIDSSSRSHSDPSRPLLRLVLSDPDLRRVWDTLNGDSERALVPLFEPLVGGADPLRARLLAAAATAAIRISLETWAAPGAADTEPGALAGEVFRRLTDWLPD